MKKAKTLCFLLLALVLVSCEKAVFDEEQTDEPAPAGTFHVEFRATQFEALPFAVGPADGTRATVDIGDVCSRINLAIFNGDTKVKSVNQVSTDVAFGRIALDLVEGDYEVVVVAHSGSGAATITSPEEIKFPDNKVTDTFYYYARLSVEKDQTVDVLLKRAVAMFRLVTTDAIPSNVQQMKFYYTGGSSTFDAVKGFGCKESRQTEYRSVPADMLGQTGQFEVFTFPHSETDDLKMTVTALDASGSEVCQRVFEDLPVRLNEITQYSGSFFSGSDPVGAAVFTLKADDSWTQHDYNF